MNASPQTTQMLAWLDRVKAGDQAARNELLRGFCGRLERLARKMLRRFPSVARWAQTDDVLNSSLLRLLRALEKVSPTTTQEFFGLAAEQMRRELLDLARRFYGPHGLGANHDSQGASNHTAALNCVAVDQSDDPEDLERWSRFHDEVARLPSEEREVVGLVFYHGWKQAEVARLLGVTVRTVQRRWQSALLQLHDAGVR